MLQRYILVTLLSHPCNTFLHLYYTMLHFCDTFAASLLYHITPLQHFCYILVTLLLYPYFTIYIVAFCPFLTLWHFVLWHFVRIPLRRVVHCTHIHMLFIYSGGLYTLQCTLCTLHINYLNWMTLIGQTSKVQQ